MACFLLLLALLAVFTQSAVGAAMDDDSSDLTGGAESDDSSLFNITKILNKYPDYSSFNSLLSQHKVAGLINRRKTITVLAVSDTSAITSDYSKAAIKRILMNHVILDFIGMPKLKRLKRPAILTTMLQTTGATNLRQGFINVSKTEDGDIMMGSAVPDAERNSEVLKAVMMQPYDICVLAISSPIIAPGVDKMVAKDPSDDHDDNVARAPKKARAPSREISSPPVSEEEEEEEEEVADSPARKKRAKAPSPRGSAAVPRSSVSVTATALMGLLWLLALLV